jgi:hypothetical protein
VQVERVVLDAPDERVVPLWLPSPDEPGGNFRVDLR